MKVSEPGGKAPASPLPAFDLARISLHRDQDANVLLDGVPPFTLHHVATEDLMPVSSVHTGVPFPLG